jgi:GAF domain-containing protein
MASVLLPVWGLILLSVADIVVISILPAYLPNLTPTLAGTFAGNFTTLGILLVIAVIVRNAIERQRVAEIEKVNQELDETQASLKQNVEESTKELGKVRQEGARRSSQLQTIAEVARAISLVQEIEQLLINVANLISERFGFYHVGIFLVDELREYAVLRAASSPGGKRMLVRSHQLRIGQTGIVGYVSELGEPRYALDTGEDAVFFDNPELPETRSELGLPLKVGDRIIGVLDVQSKEQAAFSDEDIEAMSTLAAQVAVAIENARLFGETRRALTEVQTVYGQYLRQEWSHTAGEIRQIGYRQTPIGVEALAETVDLPEIQSAIKSGQTVVLNKESALAVPLKLRGEVIGVLDIRVPDTSRQWEKDEIAAIEAVAERTALALENARLFEQTSRRADRERTVSEITTKIRSTADPQSMLQIALQELKRVLGARDIQIRPYAPEQTAEKESISGRRKRLTSKPQ